MQLKFPTYFDLVCVPQRFIRKKCRQLDGAVAGRSRFNCHCEGLLVEIDKSDFYCLLFCESHWPPSVAVNNIVIFMFPLAFLSTPIFVNTNKYQVEKTCWLWFRVYLLPTRLLSSSFVSLVTAGRDSAVWRQQLFFSYHFAGWNLRWILCYLSAVSSQK